MSGDYDDTNRWQVWGNREKRDERDRDFRGDTLIECPHCKEKSEYWLSGWKRVAGRSDKAPALSGTVTAKDDSGTRTPPKQSSDPSDMDDDIPF